MGCRGEGEEGLEKVSLSLLEKGRKVTSERVFLFPTSRYY